MSRRDDAQGKTFVGDRIVPARGSGNAKMAAAGEPGLPARFTWRDEPVEVVGLIGKWKTDGACRHGSGERYVRRHWYRILTGDGREMTIYCDRQARDRSRPQVRWFLFTIDRDA